MATYTLISSNVLSSSAASVTFSSIPATYTDLVLRASMRDDFNGGFNGATYQLRFNGDDAGSTLYSRTMLIGNGSAASSTQNSSVSSINSNFGADSADNTASTFSNNEIYIPSYTASQNKPLSAFDAVENNATAAKLNALAGLYRNTSAITQIQIIAWSNFISGTSFYLYGISNA
jgi:hypothetical protein